MIIKIREIRRKSEGDYGEKNLWKSSVLSLEWNRDGVMHSEVAMMKEDIRLILNLHH